VNLPEVKIVRGFTKVYFEQTRTYEKKMSPRSITEACRRAAKSTGGTDRLTRQSWSDFQSEERQYLEKKVKYRGEKSQLRFSAHEPSRADKFCAIERSESFEGFGRGRPREGIRASRSLNQNRFVREFYGEPRALIRDGGPAGRGNALKKF